MPRRPNLPAIALALLAAVASADAAEPTVKTDTFDAPSVGRKMACKVSLPADYDASPDKRYPVLYLLHGYTSNYLDWERLGAARAARGLDLIVVMPDGGNSWYANWAESAEGQKNNWDDYLVKDLIPHIDATYRTVAAREGRAINGLSMGGYGSLLIGLRHPEMFCSIGSHSGAIGFVKRIGDRLRSGEALPERKGQLSATPNQAIEIDGFRSQAERSPKGKLVVKAEDADAIDPFKLVLAVPKEKLPQIYVDCGTEDNLIGQSRDFAKLLQEHKIAYIYGESPGGHNPPYWMREIGTSMAVQYAILKRSLPTTPRESAKATMPAETPKAPPAVPPITPSPKTP